MAKITAKMKWKKNNIDEAIRKVHSATKNAMHDITDDLARTASGAAPHDEGILDTSSFTEVDVRKNMIIGAVGFKNLFESSFNYTLWTHEYTYNLGEGSLAKSGGTSGISGKHYDVGNKYLERPFKGNKNAYVDYIEDKVEKNLEELK